MESGGISVFPLTRLIMDVPLFLKTYMHINQDRVGMDIILITGSAGLIGSEATKFFCEKGFTVVGIDCDMRKEFFGDEASTQWNRQKLEARHNNYTHKNIDIRSDDEISRVMADYGADIKLVIHTAAQPSHDWAAKNPAMDFSVNALGTHVMLENTRKFCRDAPFVFTSTNKVYGDTPNALPLEEEEMRWEIKCDHPYYLHGIDEMMSIDQSKHSLFGASKVAADVLVQEYGRYFGMKTACFRGGCLTGSGHSGTELHGFLSYLIKCALTKKPYTVFGYQGKQVRDNIHSHDLVNMFWHYYQNPRQGEVYNAGGSRHSNCSILEAIAICEDLTGEKVDWSYREHNRSGDHIWWISDVRKFQSHYPDWSYEYGIRDIIEEIVNGLSKRL